jgi:uncharacterized membrane protein
MNLLSRALRHLLTTSAAGRRAFPADGLKNIESVIAQGEQLHRAEVKLIVEPSMPLSAILERQSARERACELFAQYRVWDTEENCGILLYINLADHDVEIVADRTVTRLLSQDAWDETCAIMTRGFARGAYCESTVAGLQHLNSLLAARMPDDGSRANQLSDRPVML